MAIVDPELKFLDQHVVVYYAGLDDMSLPGKHGRAIIERTALRQVRFIKALCLVADYVVIPPSFFFYWTAVHSDARTLKNLQLLYSDGMVLSPIYSSMTKGTDFLDYKMQYGSKRDMHLILMSKKLLSSFFAVLPVVHRDVLTQSSRFQQHLILSVEQAGLQRDVTERLLELVLEPRNSQVVASREALQLYIDNAFYRHEINVSVLHSLYYAINAAYYGQGAQTHGAFISTLHSPRYVELGADIFDPVRGVTVAYDPDVLLKLLAHLGVSDMMIDRLSLNDLHKIRSSDEFRIFKGIFRDFSSDLQKTEMLLARLSPEQISAIRDRIEMEFFSRYHIDERRYLSMRQNVDLVYTLMTTSIVSAIGLKVASFTGLILNILPIVLQVAGLNDKVADYVIARLGKGISPFYSYGRILKEVVAEVTDRLQLDSIQRFPAHLI